VTIFWAFVAGLLTLINPCVLPLLPIVIASAFASNRYGPLALAAGLVLSFTVIGVGITAFGHLLGIDIDMINRIAAVMMILFGILLLIPQSQSWFTALTSPLANKANERLDNVRGDGLTGQFMVGTLLGAVWSPCIGPTLGGAIGLAAAGENMAAATLTMLAFGLGAAVMLTALAYGSREVLAKRRGALMKAMPWTRPILGACLLIVGVVLFMHWHRAIEGWLLDVLPAWLIDLSVSV